MHRTSIYFPCVALLLPTFGVLPAAADEPIDIGSRRELLVDDYLIDEMYGGAELRLHRPTPREVVFVANKPWEGSLSAHFTILRDGDIYRMYYRGWDYNEPLPDGQQRSKHKVVCYAESKDAIHWTRPELGIVEFDGSTRNNIILDCTTGPARNGAFAVFKDENPHCAADARYKAIARHSKGGRGLHGYQSSDAIHWSLMHDAPVITHGAFDSHNVAFWDEQRGEYRAYFRFFKDGVRDIRVSASNDYQNWSEPKDLQYDTTQTEHLYTNSIRPYYRAPHLYVGFPARFVPSRKVTLGLDVPKGPSDGLFMTSRDGVRFRRWGEAYIRPGLRRDRWVSRNNFPAWALLETPSDMPGGPHEISIFAHEGLYVGRGTRLRRYTMRIDGFVSVRAPLSGGQFVTKPLLVKPGELEINFATSAAGGIRVEIQDEHGRPLPGLALADCPELFGDELEHIVRWKDGADPNVLSGKAVRLRFELKDADLYSFRFR